MLETLPDVAADWIDLLPTARQLDVGVGVHTGTVQVGNAGSRRRMKYGPRGSNVHLTARVESATKMIGLPLLVTRDAAMRLSSRLLTYRVCRAQLPGIDQPIDLFGIRPATSDPAVAQALADYRWALERFEAGELREAAGRLNALCAPANELPVAFLKARVDQALGRERRRRSSDASAHADRGVITLNVK
jgi:adenylate cyclase